MAAPSNILSRYKEVYAEKYTYSELSKLNPYISDTAEDILYHICLGNKSHDLPKMFGDVQFVIMAETPKRAEQFAYFIMHETGFELPPGTILNDISKTSHRYAMFKVGPVLAVSHGVGMASIGTLLHELIKLMYHAKIKDPVFIRVGTCDGFATEPGTVVITEKVLNNNLESVYELPVIGTNISFPCDINKELVEEFSLLTKTVDFPIVTGTTFCTQDFYEGAGRTNGAICEFTIEESLEYYRSLQKNGIINVEMESIAFAAFTRRAGIKSAIITVILNDLLQTNQVKQPSEMLIEWEVRPNRLVAHYIKSKLNAPNNSPAVNVSSVTLKPNICTPCFASSGNTTNNLPFISSVPSVFNKKTRPPCIPFNCPKAWSDSSKGTPHSNISSPSSSELLGAWSDCYKSCPTRQENTCAKKQTMADSAPVCRTPYTGSKSEINLSSSTSNPHKSECGPSKICHANSNTESVECSPTSNANETANTPICFTSKCSDTSSASTTASDQNLDSYKACTQTEACNKKSLLSSDINKGSNSDIQKNQFTSTKSKSCQSCDGVAKHDYSQNHAPSSSSSLTDSGFPRYKCLQKCSSKKETSKGIYDDSTSEILDPCLKKSCGTDLEEELPDFSYKKGKEESAKLFIYHSQKKYTENRRLKQLSCKSSMENKKYATKRINCYFSQSENPLSPGSSFEQYNYFKERQVQELSTASPAVKQKTSTASGTSSNESDQFCSHETSTDIKGNYIPENTRITSSCSSHKRDSPNETGTCSSSADSSKTNRSASVTLSQLSKEESNGQQTNSENKKVFHHRASCPWVLSCKREKTDDELIISPETPDVRVNNQRPQNVTGLLSDCTLDCPWTFPTCAPNPSDGNADGLLTLSDDKVTSKSVNKVNCPVMSCKMRQDDKVTGSSETPDVRACQKGSTSIISNPQKSSIQGELRRNKSADTFSNKSTDVFEFLDNSCNCCPEIHRNKNWDTESDSSSKCSSLSEAKTQEETAVVLCRVCRNFQENRSKTSRSIIFNSQPEIVKCPNKLKRLKEECQGYD